MAALLTVKETSPLNFEVGFHMYSLFVSDETQVPFTQLSNTKHRTAAKVT